MGLRAAGRVGRAGLRLAQARCAAFARDTIRVVVAGCWRTLAALARAGRVAEIERIKKGQAGRGGTIQTSGRTGAADAAAGPAGSAADTGRIGPRASRIVEANTRIAGRAPNDLRRNISRKK